jgi:hypothetical protein
LQRCPELGQIKDANCRPASPKKCAVFRQYELSLFNSQASSDPFCTLVIVHIHRILSRLLNFLMMSETTRTLIRLHCLSCEESGEASHMSGLNCVALRMHQSQPSSSSFAWASSETEGRSQLEYACAGRSVTQFNTVLPL